MYVFTQQKIVWTIVPMKKEKPLIFALRNEQIMEGDDIKSQRDRNRTPIFIFLIAFFFIAFIVYYITTDRNRDIESGNELPLQTEKISPSPINAPIVADSNPEFVLQAKGHIVARRIATVSSVITARVEEILVKKGSTVNQGQLLARLDSSKKSIDVKLSGAQIAELHARLKELIIEKDNAKKIYFRLQPLLDKNAISELEYDDSKKSYLLADAKITTIKQTIIASEFALELKKKQLEDFLVTAPFAGYVVEINAQVGEVISPDSTGGGFTRSGLCTLVDQSSVMGEVYINEELTSALAVGQRVRVKLISHPDDEINAEVEELDQVVDKQKGALKVLLKFLDHQDLLKIGMRIDAKFL